MYSFYTYDILPQGTFDNNLGQDRLAGLTSRDLNDHRQPIL